MRTFPRSLSTLFKIIRRAPRLSGSMRDGAYVEVESALERLTMADAVSYYQETYAHDDKDGTEVIFLSNHGEVHVVRVERPQPTVDLIPVRVAS